MFTALKTSCCKNFLFDLGCKTFNANYEICVTGFETCRARSICGGNIEYICAISKCVLGYIIQCVVIFQLCDINCNHVKCILAYGYVSDKLCGMNCSHVTDSSTVPKYPQVSLVKILGVGCYFRDCEIQIRKVANSLENLQMCSKSCNYALNVCKYA